jgi:hypothetical protein
MPNRLSRYCEGIMEAGWLLALILTPLFFNVYSSRVFEPDKIALLRSLALIVSAAWLIKLIQEGGVRYENFPAAQFRSWQSLARLPLAAPVAGFILSYLISTLFSVSPYTSLFGSYQRMQASFTTFSYIVLFAAVAANVRRRDQIERLVTAVIVTSLPISLYGILQHYRLDPLPWGGDTVRRVTGNMGNAIFLAAYLIMAALLTLGRAATTAHAILTEEANFARNVLRLTCYVIVLALNFVATWFTQSRGPLIGLAAGLFIFAILLALYWGDRWRAHQPRLSTAAYSAAIGAIVVALTGAALVAVLNIPNGPLQAWRSAPTIGRLAQMLDEIQGRTGSGRVRALIWQGVVELMLPHPPLEYPEGRTDVWNAIRPLVGYGPEALYVAYNRFYPPELAQREARNASPDRSHNETFDAIAFTGLIGLGVYMALFILIFYYGLKWLGFVDSPLRRNVLLALILGAGAISAFVFVRWQGLGFFGVGLPFGMLGGLVLFLLLYGLVAAVRGLRAAQGAAVNASAVPAGDPWRAIALISVFSAIVAHFGEIHFGIAIVSTRTHFWVFTALLMVLGYILPAARPGSVGATAPGASSGSRRKQRASARGAASAEAQRARAFWGPISIASGVMAAVLATLSYNFISNAVRSAQTLEILWESLTALKISQQSLPDPNLADVRPYGVLVMVVLAWLIGGVLAYLEEAPEARQRQWLEGLGVTLALTFAAGLITMLVLSARLAANAAAQIDPQNLIPGFIASARRVAGVLALYYLALFVLLLFLAATLARDAPHGSRSSISAPKVIGYSLLAGVALVFSAVLNLQVIQADIIYKIGLQLDDQGQPQISIPLYDQVLKLAPSQDYYYLFLARAYLNRSQALSDPADRDQLFALAETQLKEAQGLNPLNTDHTANLARINRQWAALSQDAAVRAEKAQRSSAYYEQALSLSPHNAGLWNEWATIAYQLLNDGDTAQARLDESFRLDRDFEQTYEIQGNLYLWRAGQTSDAAVQSDYSQKAIQSYRGGLEVVTRLERDAYSLRIALASAYAAAGQPALAIEQYLLAAPQARGNQWQVYQAVAELYRQVGDVAQALNYGQLALSGAPETEKANIQNWLNALSGSQ